jgi:KDO2-lipid IV(A) lauroyltransferase
MQMDAIVDPTANSDEYASVEVLTQWYNDVLSRRIRELPEQYWWLHDRWKETTAPKRRKRKPAAATIEAQRPAA